MPIRTENRARYPRDWKAIRSGILMRAGNMCECAGECGEHKGDVCMLHNGEYIARHLERPWEYITADDVESGRKDGHDRWAELAHRVVLTVAHLDHTPENNDPLNLRAMCQRCHLLYDKGEHQKNARETRRKRKAVGDLFDAEVQM